MGVKYPASPWTNALVFESATLGTLPSKFGEDQPQRFAGGSFVVRAGLVGRYRNSGPARPYSHRRQKY